jgi:hypothetical protein
MKTIILATAAILAVATAALADGGGFDGSVISRTYQKPGSGCGYGAGYYGPGCPYSGYYCPTPDRCYYRNGYWQAPMPPQQRVWRAPGN